MTQPCQFVVTQLGPDQWRHYCPVCQRDVVQPFAKWGKRCKRQVVEINERGPCAHLGPELERRRCPTCMGSVLVKVFACAELGSCQLKPKLAGVPSCEQCALYQSIKSMPQLADT